MFRIKIQLKNQVEQTKGPFTRAIFVAIFLYSDACDWVVESQKYWFI